MVKRRRKKRRTKLLSYTDTKAEAIKKSRLLKRKGYILKPIKKEYGGYSILGLKKKRKKKRR